MIAFVKSLEIILELSYSWLDSSQNVLMFRPPYLVGEDNNNLSR